MTDTAGEGISVHARRPRDRLRRLRRRPGAGRHRALGGPAHRRGDRRRARWSSACCRRTVAPSAPRAACGSSPTRPSRTLGELDTLIVAGGVGTREAVRDERLVAAIAALAGRARRTAAVCTGAYLLAQAGLLDDRRATTHWVICEAFARRYPAVEVDPDPIFIRDGEISTSAGVTAGMDLALALAEEDHGREVALQAARMLVVYARRPGGQSQFSVQLAHQSERARAAARAPGLDRRAPRRRPLGGGARRAHAPLRAPARAGLPPRARRHPRRLRRAGQGRAGAKPARDRRADSMDAVAARCGFAGAEVMRRAFRAGSARPRASTASGSARRSPPDHQPPTNWRRTCRSRSRSSPASRRSTRSAPTTCSRACPAPRSSSAPSEARRGANRERDGRGRSPTARSPRCRSPT